MDEKTELARRINLGPPVDLDSDSDFEDQAEILTPRTSINGNNHGELPPTYEESEAVARNRAQQITHSQGIANHSEVTVYRTEIPPDPPFQVSSDEKRAITPPPLGPRAPGLLNEALRFTENPPPTAERLALVIPIAVPSFAGDSVPVKFARFYAPALNPQSVAASEFIEFVDGLNNLAIASNFSASTHHSRNVLSTYEVSRDDENIQQEDLVSAYIALSNSHFFHPRGLQVQLADLAELVDLLKIGNAAIRKAILQEVLRMSRTGVDVPAAANGAAHQAAEALVPYVETLTTAVPEPRKNQEALQALALRFASLGVKDADAASLQGLDRQQTSSSSASGAGPSRSKTWGEWGNDVGRFWGDWGEKQGRFWGQWGEDQGRKWGKWGEDVGRKVSRPRQADDIISDLDVNQAEKMASGPPTWMAGPSNSRCPTQPGMQHSPQWGRSAHVPGRGAHVPPFAVHGRGSHGGPWSRGGWHGRALSAPWMPPGVSLPFQTPAQHGVPVPPMPPALPVMVTPPMPPHPPASRGIGAHPTPPYTTSTLHNAHQPPPPETGPRRNRDADDHDDEDKEEEEDEDFADIADTLSLSSVSSTSSSDSDKTFVHDQDPHAEHEALFAQKAEHIENLAAEARAKNQRPPHEIELERSRAIMDLEHEYSRNQLRHAHRAQKRELKKDIRAWKRGLRDDFKAGKHMDKAQRREWKRARKGEWRGFKTQMKEHGRAYKEERRARKREMKEVAKAAKREGKRKDWGNKRQEWDERKREWNERMAAGRGRGGRRGSRRGGGCGPEISAESLSDDLEAQAKEMLWIVVTKFEG
jgi:hypothetical protein